ncbi:MAG: RNA methyltransferase [Clostridia bacterium]|nr:RNA methyltransferase [Clostridia bacterium]
MQKEIFLKEYHAEYIKARTGSTITMLAKLQDAKYRDEYGLFIAEGIKLAREALRYSTVMKMVVCEDALQNPEAEQLLAESRQFSAGIEYILTSTEAFSKISTEKAPQGIIAVLPKNVGCPSAWEREARYLILDTIQDPGNVGTILRSAAAFGVDALILSDCADVTSPKTVRASMGAVFRCPVYTTRELPEVIGQLKENGHRVLGAALGENTMVLGKANLKQNDVIIIGNEGHGIRNEVLDVCDETIRIPMSETTESLNASIAASVLLWEYYRDNKEKEI